ncbi:hypothetical protein Aph02nite_46720 [Actinoplanes philippinensis]|uniref:TRSP domain C terminus to PRTase_2 n=1 Tax=Actinoplanes philippinensis TaxID=35752 RepID=A0A1I2I1Y0_9ACTN|nr:phosphoribosyltransferase family protein [Actinoplanes philippinensis]GIE78722.1 hypothetical protein Aph02nite_46720 [Actinoplanes philippinensis]SFF36232.1 TRSP domain C terminus to PRTase_2 [Actinoplanes philippinensis]
MRAAAVGRAVWTGSWVSERLGVTVGGGAATRLLAGLALRDNPRRAHLLVSPVLGKHVPADPRAVLTAGRRLGHQVRRCLRRRGVPGRPLVIGLAETATALGHCVADVLGEAVCLHSTRRDQPGTVPAAEFTERHSHATRHLLVPHDPALLCDGAPVVLVDDEISTGATVADAIRVLHRLSPRRHYVVAALLDTAGPARWQALSAELGADITLVATARARVTLPAGVLDRGRDLGARHGTPPLTPPAAPEVTHLALPWPAGPPPSARHGFHPADRRRLDAALPRLAGAVPPARRLLVLGAEEHMYVPLRLAAALTGGGARVWFASTTRSPAITVDDPGYALRDAIRFPAAGEPGTRFAYNLGGLGADAVLLMTDQPAARVDGLVRALGAVSPRVWVAAS